MKLRHALLAVVGVLLAAPVFAQTGTDALEAERAQIQADRKAIISHLMEMTEGESSAFWPVYNEYREAVRKSDDKLVQLATSYFKGADSMTSKQSQDALAQMLGAKAEKLSIRKSYVSKFGKVLPIGKVMRFYQIENKMDAVIDYELAASIPLIQ
jgi:hypothetical protein